MRNSQQNSLGWMLEVGVPLSDVDYLSKVNSGSVSYPYAANRVREIQEKAFQGLLSRIHKPVIRAQV